MALSSRHRGGIGHRGARARCQSAMRPTTQRVDPEPAVCVLDPERLGTLPQPMAREADRLAPRERRCTGGTGISGTNGRLPALAES